PLANALWGVAVLIAAAAIYLALKAPPAGPDVAPVAEVDEKTRVIEVHYEKVEADLSGIFRYAMTISTGGVISVSLDDSKENRHPVIAPQRLDARALSELDELLSPEALGGLEGEYIGPEPEPQALSSWRLRVVYNNAVRSVRVVNTREPPDFRTIREKLETFSKNELGIHAIQYSRDRLISLAEDSISAGRTKWEDRDVQHGNLFGAVTAFKEAIFYLDTLDPKPDCVREARRGLEDAEKELDRRFRDQRFKADRAINLGQWDEAQKELAVLLEMVPDRADERNREASAKLIDVEKRMKGGR
ncbi:MAG: hypothetical protein J6T01_03460, partial [Kiritimatiellae bacterium]|nr:hypothetical protein [Kiritimatiellia bacterium]